jgi:type IV pilus assembly protein PilC
LGQALQNHGYLFGSDEIELIRSAETMGNMPETLEEIATELENYQMIQQKIKSALSYPTALIIFTIIAVAVLLIKVVPSIVSMFPDKDKLPWITLVMIDASDFLQQFWYIIVMVIG